MRRAPIAIALAACLGLAPSCGPPAAATPEAAVSELASALREGRRADAYSLMSEGYRRRVSFEAFSRMFDEQATEVEQTAAALARRRGRAEQEASLQYGDGEVLRLTPEAGEWRVITDFVDFYDQSSPRAALRAFVRAIERRRYDIVLRLVPEADREAMDAARLREVFEGEGREESERLVQSLRASLDNPIEEVGDRATMLYGERFRVLFVREDGLWRIEDPD